MAAFLYDGLVTDHEYVQRVRQQRPRALPPVIAAASARWHSDTWWNSPYLKYTPWALADVARTSLAYGNEHRGDGNCTENDLMAMLAAYAALTDLVVCDGGVDSAGSSGRLRARRHWPGGRPDRRTGRGHAGTPSGGCSSTRGLYSTSWMRPSKVRCSIISRATSG